jgi:hypothetical protein
MAAVEKGPAANDNIAACRVLAKGADALYGARALDRPEHRVHALQGLHRESMPVPVRPRRSTADPRMGPSSILQTALAGFVRLLSFKRRSFSPSRLGSRQGGFACPLAETLACLRLPTLSRGDIRQLGEVGLIGVAGQGSNLVSRYSRGGAVSSIFHR